jgi:hypothetical protein
MLPIRSTTFKLGGNELAIKLEEAEEGKKLLIKCSGHASSGGSSWPWDSTAGGVVHGLDGDAKECVLDAEMDSRVVKITHTKDAEVAFVGITFANGKTGGDGAGILTQLDGSVTDPNNGRLKLITKFSKFFMNVAVRTPTCFLLHPHEASTLLTPCAACLQGGDGGGVFVDAFTTYVADHTIFERNEAKRGGGVFLADRVKTSSNPDVFSKAVFLASHSLFLKNVRARVRVCALA